MLPPPIYPPEEVAYAILKCAFHPRRELIVGGGGVPLVAFPRPYRASYDRIGPAITFFERRSDPAGNPEGALHAPQRSAQVCGEQPGYVMRTSLYTRAILNPGLTIATTTALAGVLGLVAASIKRRAARCLLGRWVRDSLGERLIS